MLRGAGLLGMGIAAAAGLLVGAAPAAQPPDREEVAARARGLITRRCLTCHGPEKKAGGVDLSSAEGLRASGVTGPDDPARNRLVRAVVQGRMPPTGRLPAAETALLRAWVRAGLPVVTDRARALWSLRPLHRAPAPRTRFDSLAANPVDRFVFAELERKGLRPSPIASRPALLRRVTFDLTGLPPTPQELDAFLADRAPGAYERVVDRLLASPAYGERWGRHWLDAVRFGESHGYEQNHLRPNAWPYRDWVIRALNEDMPYPRFVRLQLAGDVLAADRPEDQAATGFLVAGIHDTVGNQSEEGRRQQRANDLDDIVSSVGETFLGLTIGCAKCHDHKFDPIPQADYYRLAAVFAGVRHGQRALGPGGSTAPPNRFVEEFAPRTARHVRFTVLATADGLEPCLDELEVYGPDDPRRNLALAEHGAKPSASGNFPNAAIHQIEHLNDGRLGNSRSWISDQRETGWAQITLPAPTVVSRVVWSRDGSAEPQFRDRTPSRYRIEVSLDGESWTPVVRREDWRPAPGALVYAGVFGNPEPVFFLQRGDVMRRGEVARPGALSCLPGLAADLPAAQEEARWREALADWIVDPRNPLTPRVIVNRVWQGHFGRGLVGTPNDFGLNGEPPSHPELLDWLAGWFMDPAGGDGRLRKLHRLLVTSHVYRQGTAVHARGEAIDAGNRLLWRMPLRRLEAEALRDAILATSGKLDRRMGGPGFRLFRYRVVNVAIYEPLEEFGPDTWRRSVYRQAARSIREELLGPFDCPESSQRAPRRESTTTALQALSLLNGGFAVQQAGFFAQRVRAEAGPDPAARVGAAFRLALGRQPEAAELEAGKRLAGVEGGLEDLCRALFNANEFLYY